MIGISMICINQCRAL